MDDTYLVQTQKENVICQILHRPWGMERGRSGINGEDRYFIGDKAARILEDKLAALVPGDGVCEFGCGEGAYLRRLPAYLDRVGIELMPPANEPGITYYAADIHSTGLPDNKFDVVFGLVCLGYCADKLKVLHEAQRLLKPGGLAWFDVKPRYFEPDCVVPDELWAGSRTAIVIHKGDAIPTPKLSGMAIKPTQGSIMVGSCVSVYNI